MIRRFTAFVAIAAIALAVTIALLGPATKFGLISYVEAFGFLRLLALPTMVATALSLVGLILALVKRQAIATVVLALLGVVIGGVVSYAPIKMRSLAAENPMIHDITTDFEHPPQIVAAASLARSNPPAYVGDQPAPQSDLTTRQAQAKAFPDLTYWVATGSVSENSARARDALAQLGLEILDEREIENGTVIEAYHRSFWYGFYDDFVVRVTAVNKGSRIDVRSKSRVGISDLGANAKRIREFRDAFNAVTDAG